MLFEINCCLQHRRRKTFSRGKRKQVGRRQAARKRNGEILDTEIGLFQRKNRNFSARIPLQSENAFGAFSDSFPPG